MSTGSSNSGSEAGGIGTPVSPITSAAGEAGEETTGGRDATEAEKQQS